MKKLKLLLVGLSLFLLTGCPNPNPYARDDYSSLIKNTSSKINVINNDERLNYPDSFKIEINIQPTHGSAIVNEDYTITYTPEQDYIGEDVIEYQIISQKGDHEIKSGIANIYLTIKEINQIPQATDDKLLCIKNSSNELNPMDNDSDQDDAVLTITDVSKPKHGSVHLYRGMSIVYMPNKNYEGNDSFTYTITDGIAESTATVYVTVKKNNPPVANDDYVIAHQDSDNYLSVISNDFDEDQEQLTRLYIDSANGAKHGQLFIFNSKQILYIPSSGYVGEDQFTYTLSDGNDKDTATVYVTVQKK